MIKLTVNGYDFYPKIHVFHGGEVNVNILNHQLRKMTKPSNFIINATIRNSDELMELLLVKDAVDEFITSIGLNNPWISLELTYVPYARQDRVCNRGEAFSLRVFSKLINDMNFDRVVVFDAHSIVSTALINKCVEIKQEDIIRLNTDLSNKLSSGEYVIVAPDAGSEKKAHQVAQYFGCDMIRATKRRDIATGKILEIGLIDPIPENRSFLIVDDLVDNGGTFIPLAKELKESGAKTVELYTTHAILPRGADHLFECIDEMYTTDSFYDGKDKRIKIINI